MRILARAAQDQRTVAGRKRRRVSGTPALDGFGVDLGIGLFRGRGLLPSNLQATDLNALSFNWLAQSIETSDTRQVKELMTHEVTTIPENATLADACKAMSKLKVHHLPVVGEGQKLVGIISSFDVVNAVAS